MNDFRKELLGEPKKLSHSFPISKKNFFTIVSIVVVIGYAILLLFGTNSILMLNRLNNELDFLKKRVELVKENNAKLQKELFEIKQIRGEN